MLQMLNLLFHGTDSNNNNILYSALSQIDTLRVALHQYTGLCITNRLI